MTKILIAFLMLITTCLSYSQELTKEEKELLIEVATPKRIQKWNDNKKRVVELLKVIKNKEKTIDSINTAIVIQRKSFISDLKEISKNNNKINDKTVKIDSINENLITKLRNIKFNWGKFHLQTGFQTPLILENTSIQWQQTTITTELNYSISKFELGLGSELNAKIVDDNAVLVSDYYLNLTFNIF